MLIFDPPPTMSVRACPIVTSAVSNFRGGFSGMLLNSSGQRVTIRVMNVRIVDQIGGHNGPDRVRTIPVAIPATPIGPHEGKLFALPQLDLIGALDIHVTFGC